MRSVLCLPGKFKQGIFEFLFGSLVLAVQPVYKTMQRIFPLLSGHHSLATVLRENLQQNGIQSSRKLLNKKY